MRVLHVGICVFSFALAGCPEPPQVVPDAGPGCPANSEPTDRGTCQCLQGYLPNLAGTACIRDDGTPDGGAPPPDAGGPDGGAPDGGGPDGGGCAPQPYPEADSRAYFDANIKTEFLSCAYCHAAAPGPVNGDLQFDTNTAWQIATERIEPGAATAADTTIGKILRVDGAVLSTHAHAFPEAEAAASWIGYHLTGVVPPGCE